MVAMPRFASGTTVTIDRSRSELERVLRRYGALRFGTMSEEARVLVVFRLKGRDVQMTIPMPGLSDFLATSRGRRRAARAALLACEDEHRRRWRVLILTVKALLESVEAGLVTFDEAFLAHIVVPDTGQTVGAHIVHRLDAVYQGEKLLALPPAVAKSER